MMRNAKLWSVLLAAVLLCALTAGVLFTGTSAAEAVVLNVGADSFQSIEAALTEAEAMAANGDLGEEGVKILVSANQTATVDADGILFSQKTIWLDMDEGKKLPIEIQGKEASVVISLPEGMVACTNDYTFSDLQLAVGAQATDFYAGSGAVTFERVTFGGTAGRFFADNYTAAAFRGWPSDYSAAANEDGLIVTSLTFGENSEYYIDADNKLAAVGFTGQNSPLSAITAKITDAQIEQVKEDAKEVSYFASADSEDIPDIKPIDTKAVLVIDTQPTASEISGKSHCIAKPTVRYGLAPVAEAELSVYSGVIKVLRADRCNSAWETFVGDTYLNVYGGTFTNNDHFVRGLNASNTVGSFHVYVTQLDENVQTQPVGTDGGLQQTFGSPRVTESCTLTIDGGTLKAIYGGTADKKVINTVTGGKIGNFYGSRFVNNETCDIETYITGGTFTGLYCPIWAGSSSPTNAKSVTTKVSGGTFANVFYTASNSQAYTTLINGVSTYYLANQPELGDNDGVGPVLSGYVTGAYLKNSGKVLNVIEAGTFNGKNTDGVGVFLGAHTEHNGGVENVINGGTFQNYVYAGGQTSGSKVSNTKGSLDLDGQLLPAVKNTINGGTFHGFWGAYGIVSGSVVTTVNGGDFYPYQNNPNYPNSFAGGTRTASVTALPDITNYVYGGTFHSNFYAGSGVHSKGTTLKEFESAQLNTYIYGGTFKMGIFGNSKHSDVGPLAGNANLTIDPSKSETALAILGGLGLTDGDTSHISIVGGDEAILIGAGSNLIVDSVTGTAKFQQTEGWLAHDYLTIPVGSQYEIIESPDIFGTYFTEDDIILVRGNGIFPASATIRLSDRLGIRVLFNKDDVDQYGDLFTYKVTFKDKTLLEGTKADLEEYQGYYSIVFDGIGLSDFAEYAVISGPCMKESYVSIVSLATNAKLAWANDYPEWAEYADAIIEFHNVYNLDAENTLTPDAVAQIPSAARGAADGVTSASATLLMADAAGVRLSVTLNAAPVGAKIFVNGNEVDAQMVSVSENTITADLYFAHEYLANEFIISVQSDAGEHMTYRASIEGIANQLASNENNENKDNAQAFLVYIQKAVACK